jgi:hypothetical protein
MGGSEWWLNLRHLLLGMVFLCPIDLDENVYSWWFIQAARSSIAYPVGVNAGETQSVRHLRRY